MEKLKKKNTDCLILKAEHTQNIGLKLSFFRLLSLFSGSYVFKNYEKCLKILKM